VLVGLLGASCDREEGLNRLTPFLGAQRSILENTYQRRWTVAWSMTLKSCGTDALLNQVMEIGLELLICLVLLFLFNDLATITLGTAEGLKEREDCNDREARHAVEFPCELWSCVVVWEVQMASTIDFEETDAANVHFLTSSIIFV
jgi:hypothetical protein